jgi:RNA polymerase sigma factor (sigma-70 family)
MRNGDLFAPLGIQSVNAHPSAVSPARAAMSAEADRTDAQLAAAGDSEAFGRLYWRHAARVRALARRLLGADEADDGAQEVFVRAWHRLHQFRGDAAFGTWLHRLAVNVLLRELERNRLRTADDAALEGLAANPAAAPDSDLARALATIPARLREVVVLHDMEGYTHDEIGELLGIGRSASKMRLHRGRLALRGILTKREGHDDR